jgi:chemotaxis protein MotB
MFKEKKNDNSNFWISYADLMAGLLFVFILLIGAIVTKSITMRNILEQKQEALKQTTKDLEKKQLALQETTNSLKKKEQGIHDLNSSLQEKTKTIKLQKDEIYSLKSLLDARAKELKNKNKELNKTHESLIVTKEALELKENEVKRLNQLLLAKNTKIDKLNGKVVILQNLFNETNTTLQEKDKKIQDYKDKVLILSKNLTETKDELNVSSKKLLDLLSALDQKKTKYENLLAKLQKQKEKIKYLTGIKLRVIDELKKTLGDSVNVTKDGALKLNSKVLFDKGSAELKDSAKEELKKIFTNYITALMSNQAIAPNIETIVIEGHTDSDGGYLYNLKLSQERAQAVMTYLQSLPISKKYNLQKLLTASGRSFMDKVMVNGKEDKEASRRIEIKFRIKNQNAFYEIEKILDENN